MSDMSPATTPAQVTEAAPAPLHHETIDVLRDIRDLLQGIDRKLEDHGQRLCNVEDRMKKHEGSLTSCCVAESSLAGSEACSKMKGKAVVEEESEQEDEGGEQKEGNEAGNITKQPHKKSIDLGLPEPLQSDGPFRQVGRSVPRLLPYGPLNFNIEATESDQEDGLRNRFFTADELGLACDVLPNNQPMYGVVGDFVVQPDDEDTRREAAREYMAREKKSIFREELEKTGGNFWVTDTIPLVTWSEDWQRGPASISYSLNQGLMVYQSDYLFGLQSRRVGIGRSIFKIAVNRSAVQRIYSTIAEDKFSSVWTMVAPWCRSIN